MPMSCGFPVFLNSMENINRGWYISSHHYFMFYSIIPNQKCQGFFHLSFWVLLYVAFHYFPQIRQTRGSSHFKKPPFTDKNHPKKSIHHKWSSIFYVGSKNQTADTPIPCHLSHMSRWPGGKEELCLGFFGDFEENIAKNVGKQHGETEGNRGW